MNRKLATEYHLCFISRFYPGIHLSANSVSRLFDLIGQDTPKREAFFKRRMSCVQANLQIVIDSMLKQDTSIVNDFSAFTNSVEA